jgi:hypothetical protein
MHASQLADVKALLRIVDTAPQILRDEMIGQYSGIIAVCRFIISEEVTAISDAFAADLAQLRADFHTLVIYQTWQAPGEDIPCVVTTDEDGFITSDSTLTVGGIHVATFSRRGSGRLATLSLATISGRIIGLMLNVAADFSKGAAALTEMRDDEGMITGYSFNVRHRTV